MITNTIPKERNQPQIYSYLSCWIKLDKFLTRRTTHPPHLLDSLDLVPVSARAAVVFMLPQSTVHCQHAAAGTLDEARVVQGVLELGKHADLAAHRRGVHSLYMSEVNMREQSE